MEKMELCISYIDTIYETKPETKAFTDIIEYISGAYHCDWHRGCLLYTSPSPRD